LFVRTKDVDLPEWRIEFDYKPSMDRELKQWMEILTQFVGENRSSSNRKPN